MTTASDPVLAAIRSEEAESLYRAIDALEDRRRFVFVRRVFTDDRLEDIGKVLGVSRERVWSLYRDAARRLIHKLVLHSFPLYQDWRTDSSCEREFCSIPYTNLAWQLRGRRG